MQISRIKASLSLPVSSDTPIFEKARQRMEWFRSWDFVDEAGFLSVYRSNYVVKNEFRGRDSNDNFAEHHIARALSEGP